MRPTPATVVVLAWLAAAPLAPVSAAELPAGPGLASRYPGDAGIARDTRVLLHEDFEVESLTTLKRRWDEVSDKDGKVLALSDDTPAASAGRRSLQLTATLDENTGGHLYRRLPREVDQVFVRFYVKFAEDSGYLHHFVQVGGYRPATAWPQGGAGSRPRGDERFTIGIEPFFGDRARLAPPGAWNFYCYWPEMKVSAGGRYWGNGLRPAETRQIPQGTWQCVETMVKLNSTPQQRDGELALWIDGELQTHIAPGVPRSPWTGQGFQVLPAGQGEPFEGFRWRTDERLKVNFVWLLHYVTDYSARRNRGDASPTTNRVYFDDVVVATEYIGPLTPPLAPQPPE